MAKFIGCTGDLVLRDNEKITFGDGNDSNMWFDGSELRLDTTISGVDPTQDYHLATKSYVDGEISTVSSSIITDHGSLTGLGDDDHYQYVPTDGSRGFTSTVSGIDPIQDYDLATKLYVDDEILALSSGIVLDHGSLTGLADDDHTQYILVDGSRAFTSTVGGVTPIADSDLTTKQYVDQLVQGLDWQDSVLSIAPAASGIAVEGNRYIADSTGSGWTEDWIYEYTGTTWSGIEPNEGFATWVEDADALFVYNGTDWVRFGSTVIHNNLSGLQGGTTDEYYHLTSDEYTSLTSAGGVEDASDMHTHDDRYYTETEMDATISGIQSSIITDHGGLTGLGDDDHTQYILVDGSRGFTSTVSGVSPIQDYDLATKKYVDDEIATLSGSIVLDHGGLTGLADDDHLQYVPTDGSRGFTSTVSGVDPVQDYDLATKSYVDSQDSPQLHGRYSIANDTCTFTVTFSGIGHTNYTIASDLENTSDSPPSVYAYIISAKTQNSFDVTLMGDTDSPNYVLNWLILED
jgi:hypothetical protein